MKLMYLNRIRRDILRFALKLRKWENQVRSEGRLGLEESVNQFLTLSEHGAVDARQESIYFITKALQDSTTPEKDFAKGMHISVANFKFVSVVEKS